MPTTEPETWEPLAPNELVFRTREDWQFVAYSGPGSTFFIAVVRKRDGVWMKRTDPLKPVSALTIRDLWEWGRYRKGAELLALTPQRPYLKVA
jgi:hypothetical protein